MKKKAGKSVKEILTITPLRETVETLCAFMFLLNIVYDSNIY